MATLGNILAIRALWKASSLPANLRKLFLSLTLSNLAVGLLANLMLGVVFKMALDENCNLDVLCLLSLTLCYIFLYLLISASFLNVTAIGVDRLLAVSLSSAISRACDCQTCYNGLGCDMASKLRLILF